MYYPPSAICMMEGCNWRGGGVCVNCGARLRCPICERFVTERNITAHCNAHELEPAAVSPLSDAPKEQTDAEH